MVAHESVRIPRWSPKDVSMLPNIPSLKAELQEILSRYIRVESHRKLGALSLSPVHIIHEGDQMKTLRADGSVDVSEMKKASGQVAIPVEKVGKLSNDDRVELLEKITDEMAQQMAVHLYGVIDEVLEGAGQVVNGKNMTPAESMLAMFEKMQIDFDEQGNIKDLVISAGAQALEGIRKAEAEMRSNPELEQQWENLLERKRGEWRDREAARKLVG